MPKHADVVAKKPKFGLILALTSLLWITAATAQEPPVVAASKPTAAASAAAHVAAAACTDFDAFVNAAWERDAVIPANKARIGSFDELATANERVLSEALSKLADEPQQTVGLQALAKFHAAAMDEKRIEAAGLTPIAPWLARIEALGKSAQPRAELGTLLAAWSRARMSAPLVAGVDMDSADPTRHRLSISPSGLGLPQRDDYFGSDGESQRVQTAYRAFASAMLAHLTPTTDADTIKARVEAVFALEKRIAESHLNAIQRRDPERTFNPRLLASLPSEAPGIDWAAWLKTQLSPNIEEQKLPLNLVQPAVAKRVAELAQSAPIAAWQDYLRLRLMSDFGSMMSAPIAATHFAYFDKALRGIEQPPARSERFMVWAGGRFGEGALGKALGELFVAKAFSASAQREADVMVGHIRRAMQSRIDALEWMSAPTKAEASAKLQAMVAQIGAPAPEQAYAKLVPLLDVPFASAVQQARVWAYNEDLRRLPQPVDRTRWFSSAHIVNAFAAGGNRIVFPAGILQPPFFDEAKGSAQRLGANFGAIGMVIGHEITHHFDDRGRQFDSVGKLRDWWTPADAVQYKTRADQLAAFYSNYEPAPGVKINGQQMNGENISDVAGIQIAFDGLQLALTEGQFTAEQRAEANQSFFTAHARIWRGKQRVQSLIQQLRTGQHSPGRYRVLGPLGHSTDFAKTFGCKPGDPMVADPRIVIW